ncbi:MAG: hypothetical protein KatS3mg057_1177 [Herpetosiphonaceae bacterium]|nr:MAG: hypothetical protein KatS3mg057_1177 [Herpetosiphonaceae bacterium]
MLHIVLGEQVPTIYSLRSPERTTICSPRLLLLFNIFFNPLIRFLDWITNVLLRMLGVRESIRYHAVPTLVRIVS